MKPPDGIASIQDVCEVTVIASPEADPSAVPDLLFEVPHGATRRSHFDAVRHQLSGDLPEDLVDFFFVNTDVGATEVARRVAELVAGLPAGSGLRDFLGPDLRRQVARLPPRKILVLRCLIPRTFIDTNRIVDAGSVGSGTGLSPAVHEYIREKQDAERLYLLYARYQSVAEAAYELVCGSGGLALIPHTYAPKTVSVESHDEGIGSALRKAYEPEQYEKWHRRPAVDILSEGPDGVKLAPPCLAEAIKSNYARIGIRATENVSYQLHPATMGYRRSERYPAQVLCLEIARDLLAEPFAPFEEMRIGERKVETMSAPVAAALVAELAEKTQSRSISGSGPGSGKGRGRASLGISSSLVAAW